MEKTTKEITEITKGQPLRAPKKKKNRSQLGPNFVAPDGGWGWVVAIAAGFSNLVTLPVFQQCGLLFRERFQALELAVRRSRQSSTFTSLANGPLFRRFTYRQVAYGAAFVAVSGLLLTSIADSFITYVITFSILYGIGSGVNMSSNALALNTYFKEKRRMATSFSWTVTALGPIVLPHLITFTLKEYGVQGSVLIFAGIACHTFATASIFQPAQWHSRHHRGDQENLLAKTPKDSNEECEYCKSLKKKQNGVFPYIYNSDDPNVTGYEIIDPGTPMLALANDGWYSGSGMRSAYGSKWSLTSTKTSKLDGESKKTSAKASTQNLVLSTRPSFVNLGTFTEGVGRRDRRPTKPRIEEADVEDCPSLKAPQDLSELEKTTLPATPAVFVQPPPYEDGKYIRDNYSLRSLKYPDNDRRRKSNTFSVEKEVLKEASRRLEMYLNEGRKKSTAGDKCTCEKGIKTPNNSLHDEPICTKDDDQEFDEKKFTLMQKIIIFFDLDLLKDFTYVNLMVGITVANFAEINFSILTPFILGDFGYTKSETAFLMSLLAGADIGVRFIIPFVAGRIGWDNKTFFLFGVLGMAFGRVILAHFQSFWIVVAVFLCIGLGKGLRTVFMALVIPSYVPLDRLPAATGLQLLFAGIFYFAIGPLVGLIRDATDYPTTLHCLNVATYVTAISWGFEKYFHWQKERLKNKELQSDS
uniref:Major facilitator superfamily (MFS) profile domain-containing protein n=2 Tax=Lutzomyia longipalpis TaxID=7200 RepID=A0A1B0CVT5_LUTLO